MRLTRRPLMGAVATLPWLEAAKNWSEGGNSFCWWFFDGYDFYVSLLRFCFWCRWDTLLGTCRFFFWAAGPAVRNRASTVVSETTAAKRTRKCTERFVHRLEWERSLPLFKRFRYIYNTYLLYYNGIIYEFSKRSCLVRFRTHVTWLNMSHPH